MEKREAIRLVNLTKKIIHTDFYDYEYIPIQVLYIRVSSFLHDQKKPAPRQREYFSLIKSNFEVVQHTVLSVHANYKPTEENPVPVKWLRRVIKASAKNKAIITETELYSMYLEAVKAGGYNITTSSEKVYEAAKRAGFRYIAGDIENMITMI